ncbi:MAG: M13 family metallopeptidase, partial [Myxococcaceae bacterium]
MRRLPLLVLLLGCIARAAEPPVASETPLPMLPYTPGLDPRFMDRTVDPCVDFYAFSCAGWQKLNPIPPDQSTWSVYGKLSEEIERHLWALLRTTADPSAARSPVQVQLGSYFGACMDEPRIEALGATPLKPALADLAEVKDRKGLARWLAKQHMESSTSELLFGFSSEQDASDATQYLAGVYAGGLGLPDRDDYLDQDTKSKELREKYRAHVAT